LLIDNKFFLDGIFFLYGFVVGSIDELLDLLLGEVFFEVLDYFG
jgi:hypothetical protein